jgi:hypothetical protein
MPDGVVIRWWADRGRALVFYACGFAALLLIIAMRTGAFQPVHRAIMGSFALVCVYFALVRIVNTTELRVEEGRLVVRHGPLPWRAHMSVSLSQIDEVAVDRASSRLQLRTTQGEEVALVDDLSRDSATRLDGELTELMNRSAQGDEG